MILFNKFILYGRQIDGYDIVSFNSETLQLWKPTTNLDGHVITIKSKKHNTCRFKSWFSFEQDYGCTIKIVLSNNFIRNLYMVYNVVQHKYRLSWYPHTDDNSWYKWINITNNNVFKFLMDSYFNQNSIKYRKSIAKMIL